jgi:hypothetical protein
LADIEQGGVEGWITAVGFSLGFGNEEEFM